MEDHISQERGLPRPSKHVLSRCAIEVGHKVPVNVLPHLGDGGVKVSVLGGYFVDALTDVVKALGSLILFFRHILITLFGKNSL